MVEHAIIEVQDEDARKPKGKLERFINVQFNPTEYTLNKGAQIAEIGIYGIDSPILQFVRGQNEKLTMELFFDTTTLPGGLGDSAVSVTTLTEPFYQLCKIQPKTHAPPRINFTWSEKLSFRAIVESVQRKFMLFNPKGVPLRATLSITFREYKTLEDQLAELKLDDQSQRVVAHRGDTLSQIADQVYGDSRLWRRIAEANPDVGSPRQLRAGQVLVIPPLETFSRPQVDGR